MLKEVAGVKDEQIRECGGTGLVIEIRGEKDTEKKKIECIAIRADIDGLKMQENNPHLDYRS